MGSSAVLDEVTSISPVITSTTSPVPVNSIQDTAEAQDDILESPSNAAGFVGVHDVFKSVDYWFEREAHQIEVEADRLAGEWAAENLPTLNEVGDETLPPEEMIAKRCGDLWRRWPERVQVKLQDAIDAAGSQLASSVSFAQAAVTGIRDARDRLKESQDKIEEIRGQTVMTRGPVKYDAFISQYFGWFMAALLVAVEFIANQPVFRVIWPMEENVAAGLTGQLEQFADSGWFGGIKIALLQIMSFFEASILSFAVVALLFVLAKAIGTALRPIYALRVSDYPFASRSIESLHRQKRMLSIVSGVGTVAVLAFLFFSRGSSSTIAESRMIESRKRVELQQHKLDSIQTVGGSVSSADVATLTREQQTLSRLENELGFARTIQSNNGSILVLNVSLVCFAIVLGFMGDKRDLSDTIGEHPDLPRLKEKCRELNREIIQLSGEAKDQILKGQRAKDRVQSFSRARPLATLDAKRQRLESMIPRWRAMNARVRGLDPSSIAAFRRSSQLALPNETASFASVKPDSFERTAQELEALSMQVLRAEREIDTNMMEL